MPNQRGPRRLVWQLGFLSLLLPAWPAAQAQNFPERPIKIIVPFGAGSAVDTIARVVGAQVAEQLRQSVIIDNRTGANGIIAAEMAAKAAPDGYTLFMPNDGIMAANPALYPNLPYHPLKDFRPVTLTSTVPLVLVSNPSFAPATVTELVAAARAKPGAINFSSTGSGSAQHLAMELFQAAAGVKMTHIPYKAMAPAIADVVAGTVPVMFSGMSNVMGFAKDGKLRILGVSTPQRSAAAPDWPTIAEAGLPTYSYAAWNGIVAPAATPPGVVARLHEEFARAIASPNVKAKLASLGFDLVGAGPDAFGELIKSDVARMGKLVRDAGIQVN